MEAVLDTCVIYSGLYSTEGASFEILSLVGKGDLTPVISNSLIYEYEGVLKRNCKALLLSLEEIDRFLDGICVVGNQVEVSFMWRPHLKDADDEHVLELSVASKNKVLLTHNIQDFKCAVDLGVSVYTPRDYLNKRKES